MPGISLLVPTYNRAHYLAQTLASLRSLKIPEGVDVELLVINNNCTDDTVQVVKAAQVDFPYSLRLILETRQGLCHARNRGISEAKYEILGYLDDDILISPSWVSECRRSIIEYRADAVVGPVIPMFDGDPPKFVTGRALELISSNYSRRGKTPALLPFESQHELPGCNFAVLKQVAMSAGGFNPEFDRKGKQLLAGGDSDFGYRLRSQNRRVVYQPECWIRHIIVSEKITQSYLRSRAYWMGVTSRKLHAEWNIPTSRKRQFRKLLRHTLNYAAHTLSRKPQLSFSDELRMLQIIGHLRGK